MARTAARILTAVALIISTSVFVGAPLALADDDGDVKKEARKLLEAGDKRVKRGDRSKRKGRDKSANESYERALESYQKAYALVPNPAIYFAIAGAEEKLERWLEAIEHYQKVAKEVESEELRQQANQRIEELKKRVAVVDFKVTPEGAEISIDSQLRGQAPLPAPVFLKPGDYRITVTAPGYTPYEAEITVSAGKVDERAIELSKTPVVVKRPKPMPSQTVLDEEEDDAPLIVAKKTPPPSKTGVVIGATVTGALLVGATATGLLAVSNHGTFTDAGSSPDQRADARDSGKRFALITDGLLVGAVLVGSYTAYRYFFVYRSARAEYDKSQAGPDPLAGPAGPALWLVPQVSATSGGLAVGGRF